MEYNPIKHHRRSIRLRDYDYSSAGAYFVTICAYKKECVFGDIIDGQMMLNSAGKSVYNSWQWLEEQYDHVELDQFIVMPNHLHGIICINDVCGRGGSRTAPTMKQKPLGRLIGAFKTVSTKQTNIICHASGNQLWQRNYYENIIRNEESLNRIRDYIQNNPIKWELDEYNPSKFL